MDFFREIEKCAKMMEMLSSRNRKFTKHYFVTYTLHGLLEANLCPTFQSFDINLGAEIGSCILLVTPDFADNVIHVQLMTEVIKNSYFLNYRFGFKTKYGYCWHDDHTINFSESITLSETYETISNYFDPETESLEILCQMMITTCVSIPEENVKHESDSPEIDICLDFYNLFDSKYLSDIILRVGEAEIAAHKAILTSKSKIFLKMVEEMNSSHDTLVLPETDVAIVRSMLSFMYTGNLEIWMRYCMPTIAFFECVVKYAVTDLRTFLLPVEIKLTDICLIKMSEFTWRLKSVLKQTFPLCRRSPLIRTPFGSFYLKLIIENNNEDSVSIMIEPLNIIRDMSMSLKVQMFDGENKVFIAKSVNCSLKEGSGQEVGLSTIMKYNLIPPFLESSISPDDVLMMGGLVKVSNYDIVHRISFRSNETKPCEKFADFKCLLDKNKYSDFTVFAGDNSFKVHKAILGGRTSFFRDLLVEHPTLDYINETDLSPSVMKKFIVYLYSGKLDQDVETHLDLLLAFDKYRSVTPITHVVGLLEHEITLKNVCAILLTNHKLKSPAYLKKIKISSLSLLCSNFNDIEPTQSWQNLLTESEELANEILVYLQDVYLKN